jgi:hypothetical protein
MGGYAEWKNDNNITNDLGDKDDDGLSNLAEYAFGSDPRDATSGLPPGAIIVTEGADDYLAISYQKQLSATDVSIEAQISSDLTAWTSRAALVPVSETANPDGETATVVVRSADPIAPGGDTFLRIVVTLAP